MALVIAAAGAGTAPGQVAGRETDPKPPCPHPARALRYLGIRYSTAGVHVHAAECTEHDCGEVVILGDVGGRN